MSIANTELKGQHVVLKEKAMAERFKAIKYRVALATGGFGCTPGLLGTAVFLTESDGSKNRWYRYDIERLATPEEVEQYFTPGKAPLAERSG